MKIKHYFPAATASHIAQVPVLRSSLILSLARCTTYRNRWERTHEHFEIERHNELSQLQRMGGVIFLHAKNGWQHIGEGPIEVSERLAKVAPILRVGACMYLGCVDAAAVTATHGELKTEPQPTHRGGTSHRLGARLGAVPEQAPR